MSIDPVKLQDVKNKIGFVCSGGGVLGVGVIGALSRLDELDIKISQFKYFAGTSVGSIISSALACGATFEFITNKLMQLQLEKFKDDDWGIIRDTYRLWKRCGWYKGKFLEKFAYDTLGAVCGNPAITFQEIYDQFENYLVIPVMKNFSTTIYYDRFTTPDMPVFKAVRRSAGIPLFYQADVDEDIDSDDDSDEEGDNVYDMYVDGGILDNYPFHKLEEILPTEQILGLKLMSSKKLYELNHGVHTDPPKYVIEAIISLINAIREQALRLHIKKDHWLHTIKIDVGDIQSSDFDLTKTERNRLYAQGRASVDAFLTPSS